MSVQTLYTSATGMKAMETKLDVIANNLANVETTGFKKGRVNFEDLFYQNEKMPGAEDSASQRTPVGIQIGMGTRLAGIQTDHRQGAFQKTGNELDVAITGKGFFQVKQPNGDLAYTRAGNFARNSNGDIVVGSANIGRLLEPQLTIPQEATAIQISPEGIVSVQLPNNTQMQQIGRIELATFINPQGLLQLGESLFAETDASGSPVTGNPGQDGFGQLQQGMLESSNVEPVQELIDLIKTQRAFEINSQVVQAGDQVMQTIANLRRY